MAFVTNMGESPKYLLNAVAMILGSESIESTEDNIVMKMLRDTLYQKGENTQYLSQDVISSILRVCPDPKCKIACTHGLKQTFDSSIMLPDSLSMEQYQINLTLQNLKLLEIKIKDCKPVKISGPHMIVTCLVHLAATCTNKNKYLPHIVKIIKKRRDSTSSVDLKLGGSFKKVFDAMCKSLEQDYPKSLCYYNIKKIFNAGDVSLLFKNDGSKSYVKKTGCAIEPACNDDISNDATEWSVILNDKCSNFKFYRKKQSDEKYIVNVGSTFGYKFIDSDLSLLDEEPIQVQPVNRGIDVEISFCSRIQDETPEFLYFVTIFHQTITRQRKELESGEQAPKRMRIDNNLQQKYHMKLDHVFRSDLPGLLDRSSACDDR